MPDEWFNDQEFAARIYRNIAGFEYALYFYNGYWKSPSGSDMDTGLAIFPRLNVYGGSVRGPFFNGILSAEVGYYHSCDDSDGKNPAVNNSETRLLLGYETGAGY